MVKKRLVFLFPGFEPMRAREHAERFKRAARRSATVWGADLRLGRTRRRRSEAGSDAVFLDLGARLSGEGWSVRTDVVVCDWGDIILSYQARPPITRILSGLGGLLDFAITGTFFRYCRTSWRYAFFYLFPLVVLVGSLAAGGLFGWLAVRAIAGPFGVLAGLVLGCLAPVLLLIILDTRLHLLTAFDDWALARDMCRGRNRRLEQRIARQAEEMLRRAKDPDVDEVVVAAHSLGASLAVSALSRALDAPEGWPGRGFPCVLTVGSSLLKSALHPSARAQREAVADLVANHRLTWIDCQSLTDVINFYGSNPATSLGIREGRTPAVVRVRFRSLLSTSTYRRIKHDFFRIHRQFVLAVERRAGYSFHMLLLGPDPVGEFAETGSIDRPSLSPSRARKRAVAAETAA